MRNPMGQRAGGRYLNAIAALTIFLLPGPVSAQPASQPATAPVSDSSPLLAFWQEMGDPVLEALVREALDGNPDLRAAVAQVRSLEARRGEATFDLAPRITSGAAYTRHRPAAAAMPGVTGTLPDQDLWEAGLLLSWEIDLFGGSRSRVRALDAQVGSAEAGFDDMRIRLMAGVAHAYFELRGAEDRLRVAHRNATNQRSTLELTRDRMDFGHGSALDMERAQAQLSSTLAAIPILEARIEEAQLRLATLLGRTSSVWESLPSQEEGESVRPVALHLPEPDLLVDRHPHVRGAEREAFARRARVSEARATYLPRLSIDAVAGYSADAFGSLGGTGSPRYAVGPVITWPFLDMGRVRMQVEAARADATQADERHAMARLVIQEAVGSALAAYQGARNRLHHLEEAAEASERATEIARLRYEEGATDFLQVLDAERTLLDAQDRLAAGRRDVDAALVTIYLTTGGQVSTVDSR